MSVTSYLAILPFYVFIFAGVGFMSGMVVLLVLTQIIDDARKIPFSGILWSFSGIGAVLGILLNVFYFTHIPELEQAAELERNQPIIIYEETRP